MRYVVSACSVGCSTSYLDPEDMYRWHRYSKKSLTERLLGVSFEDEQEFSLEELMALETNLNLAQQQAYNGAFAVQEDGTGEFDCMKKGDLLFATSNNRGYLLTEQNGNYSLILNMSRGGSISDTKTIITSTGIKSTSKPEPTIATISLTEKSGNPYGVFPDRSYYMDADPYNRYTAVAYKRLYELKKQKESGSSNPSGMGE